jgi:hypothetical protein
MSVIDLLLSYSFSSVEFYKKMRSDSFLIWRATPCAEEEHIKIQYLVNRIQAIRFLGPAHLFFNSKYTR